MKTLTPNNFGNKHLVENCQKIQIKDLLVKCKTKFKEMILNAELDIMDINIELTTSRTFYNGIRFWFKCPICHSRIGILYKHPVNQQIGCKKCLNLDYRKRRYKGMIEEGILAKSE